MALTYHFPLQDNAASTTVVGLVGGIDGTLTNAGNTSASRVAGPGAAYPYALNFDGLNDYVQISGVTMPATGTATLWAKPTRTHNSGNWEFTFSFGANATGRLAFEHYTDNNLYYGWFRTGTSDRVVVAASALNYPQAWQHLAISWTSGGGSTVYYNATSLGTDPSTNTASAASGTLRLAAFSDGAAANFFSGALADVRIYNTVLSPSEIEAIMSEGTFSSGWTRSSNAILGVR